MVDCLIMHCIFVNDGMVCKLRSYVDVCVVRPDEASKGTCSRKLANLYVYYDCHKE